MATQYVNTYGAALLIAFFNDRNAISENNAIEIKPLDWRAMGIQLVNPEKSVRKWYPFIKEINGKYWLDRERLEMYYKRWNIVSISALIIAFGIIVASIIFATLG